jgi:hypothetical protein
MIGAALPKPPEAHEEGEVSPCVCNTVAGYPLSGGSTPATPPPGV